MQNNQTNTKVKKVIIKYTDGEYNKFVVDEWYCTYEKIYLEREGKIFAIIPVQNIFKLVVVDDFPSEVMVGNIRENMASCYMPLQPTVQ